MKRTLFLLMAMIISLSGFSQNIVTVGTGTSTNNYVPVYAYYNYSVSQSIYLQSEIDASGTITSLGYYVSSNPYTRSIKIYMAETDQESFTSTSDLVPEENFTLVYEGTVAFASGWTTISLSNPFPYTGEGNLAIAVCDVTGEYDSPATSFAATGVENRCVSSFTDNITPTGPSNLVYDYNAPAMRSSLPNIQLGMVEEGADICYSPTGLTLTSADNNSLAISWNCADENATFVVEYKLASESWEDAVSETVSETEYAITDLQATSTYNIRVATICSDGSYSPYLTLTAQTTMEAVDLPYVTDFSPESDQAWKLNNSTSSTYWVMGPAGSYMENALFVTTDGTTPGYTNSSVVTAEKLFNLDDSENIHIEFDVYCNGEGGFDFLKVFFAPATSEYPAVPSSGTATYSDREYSTYAFNFQDYFTQTSYTQYPYKINKTNNTIHVIANMPNPAPDGQGKLVFLWRADASGVYTPGVIVSNVIVGDLPCGTPTATVSDIAENTAVVNITTGGSSTLLRYKPADDEEAEWLETTTSETEYELTDLLANTPYSLQVINDCGGEQSLAFNVSFRTACVAITEVPQSWGFEDGIGTSDPLSPCWNRIGSSSNVYNYTSSWDQYASDGSYVLYIYNTGNYAILPPVDTETLPINTLQLSMKAYRSSYATGQLVVGVMTDPADVTTFVEVTRVTPGSTYGPNMESVDPISFASYEGEGQYIALAYSASDYYSVYVDEMVLDVIPDCGQPTNVAISNITPNSVDVSWDVTEGTTVNLYYKSLDANEDGEIAEEYTVVEGVEVNEDGIYTLEDLLPQTNYTLYLASQCEEELVSSSRTFITACEAITELPVTWDMETSYELPNSPSRLPLCWSRISSNGSYPYVYDNYSASGNSSLSFYYSGDYAILPTVDESIEITDLQLRFKSYSYSSGVQVQVGIMTDPMDATTFQTVGTVTLGTNDNDWSECNPVRFETYEGEGRYIAMRVIQDYYSAYIDDVVLEMKDECMPVELGSLVANTTANSAIISWVGEAENGFELRYKVYTEESADEETEEAEWITEIVEDTTFEITDLEASTYYIVDVAPVCEGVVAHRQLIFKTACDVISEFPYEETFNQDLGCWTNQIVSGSNNWEIGTSLQDGTTPHEGSMAKFFSSSTGSTARLISPIFDLSSMTAPLLKFYHVQPVWYSDQDVLTLYYRTDVSEEWTQINTWTSSITSWTLEEIVLPNTSSETYQIMFKGVSNYGYGIGIDDLTIEEAPSCMAPNGLTTLGTTSTSATISWLGMESATYTVSYLAADAEEGTEPTVIEGVSLEDGSYTIEGLEPSTQYVWTVATECEDGTLAETELTASFRTPCEAIAEFPYAQSFETDDATISCWTTQIVSGSTAWQISSSLSQVPAAPDGSRFAYFKTSSRGASARLISPIFDLSSLEAPQMTFSVVQPNWGSDQDTLGVFYKTSPTSEWTYITSFTQSMSSWEETVVTLPEPSETYQIMFQGTSDYGYGTCVDNITIGDPTACAAPVQLASSNVTENSVDLTWVGEVDTYNVYYKAEGEDTYQSVSATLDNGVYTLSNLNSSTLYTWYVAAVCEDGSESPSATRTFRTACGTVADFPYTEGFENGFGCFVNETISGEGWLQIPATEEFADYVHSGNYSVGHSYDPETSARLLSPVFDLTSLTNPHLSYYYYIAEYYGIADSLGVYYRTSQDEEWTYLASHSQATDMMTLEDIALPNPSATYQVMFFAEGLDGNAVAIDDVTIFDGENGGDDPCTPTTSTLTASICEGET
ncbi:MAG: fibronectin type III domain-containing protein, partial [Bacteroidales bacterium]|nr:fibronectin type III domain-containing protein [Bacteroidales bacterium]